MATATIAHHQQQQDQQQHRGWGSFGMPPQPPAFNAISPPPHMPYTAASPPPLKPRNDVDLTRDKLIIILEHFSQVLTTPFASKPLRLVVHGGACMLLHPMLYNLSSQQHQLHPTLPHRTSTRDVDYIHRSFIIEMSQLGVPDAAVKIKMCIEATARHFGLGADWMNSDADIALPMATGPNGITYDPIYYASVQPNNIDLHTIYRSTNGMLTLISVTPFWAVSLKLVRYVPQDAADICLLLRNGTILSNTTWTIDTLREWLFANCWVMGYSSYDRARLQTFNIRLQHAIEMVNGWGNNNNRSKNSPSLYQHSSDPNNIENLMKSDREREEAARKSNPQQSTPPQFPQPQSQFQQPQPPHFGLQEAHWSSVNLNFTPAAELGRITPEAAMGGGGYVVGGVHGQSWTSPWAGANMPVPHPAHEGSSSRNSPTHPEARDPLDFSASDFNFMAAARKEKKRKDKTKRREATLSDDELMPMNSARGSLGGLGRESTWPSFGSSMAPGPGVDDMSALQRSLDEVFPALTRPAPPIPPSLSPQPYTYQYGSPGMHMPVIPTFEDDMLRVDRKRDKEKDKKRKEMEIEKRRKEKKKEKERRIERQISAGQRYLDEPLSILQTPGPTPAFLEEYYRRALGAGAAPGSQLREVPGDESSESGEDEDGWGQDELQTPPHTMHTVVDQHPPTQFASPTGYYGNGYTSPQRAQSPPPVPGYYTPVSKTPPSRNERSIVPPIPTLPAETLIPIPPVASPIPGEPGRKSKSKEKGKRHKSKSKTDGSEGEEGEVFIPPGFDGDIEHIQQQELDRQRQLHYYQQHQHQHQQHIHQSTTSHSHRGYTLSHQQQPQYPPSSSQHYYQHSAGRPTPSYQQL